MTHICARFIHLAGRPYMSLYQHMLVFYAVRMYQYFPDRVPYVYTKNNVLANRVPGYQDLMDKVIQIIRASRS